MNAVIPARSNQTVAIRYDRELHKRRNRTLRTIGHPKIDRALATRYDKPAESFLSMAQIAAVRLRHIHDA